MALHGISVALVDSKPRELLQLNVREIELSGHTCDGVACLLQLRIGQLSLDNMIADTDSPVLLSLEPNPNPNPNLNPNPGHWPLTLILTLTLTLTLTLGYR